MQIAKKFFLGTRVQVVRHALPHLVLRFLELEVPLDDAVLTIVGSTFFSMWQKVSFRACYKGSVVAETNFYVATWNIRAI